MLHTPDHLYATIRLNKGRKKSNSVDLFSVLGETESIYVENTLWFAGFLQSFSYSAWTLDK